jgi:L-fuconolactonase
LFTEQESVGGCGFSQKRQSISRIKYFCLKNGGDFSWCDGFCVWIESQKSWSIGSEICGGWAQETEGKTGCLNVNFDCVELGAERAATSLWKSIGWLWGQVPLVLEGLGKSMILDSHQHFWQLDLPFDYGWLGRAEHAAINRSYLPADLLPHLRTAGVDATIFVQTQHSLEENRWVLKLAEQNAFIAGVVGWVDLSSECCEEQLQEFVIQPKFCGVRHITQDEPDDDFIIRPDVLRGLRVLERYAVPFDLLFYVRHLRHAAALGRQLPDLPMVVDHLAKPQIRLGELDQWRLDLRRAAECGNIYCKLSGLVTEADWFQWTVADLRPYVETALECFGVERCMFGSDWPVCELAGGYEDVVGAMRELTSGLSTAERARIFGGTAVEFYGLEAGAGETATT